VSATEGISKPTADLVAFAANGWAFREPVRAVAREIVLATLLRAVTDAHSERVEIAAAEGPGPARMRARALGRDAVTTPLHAAFLTGLAAGDDPSLATPAVCAAFAVGESVDASGASVLDAIVAGTEVAVRVERALGPSHAARGWDARGTCGRLGAAIAAARVLGLQRVAVRDAFAIAATAASGLGAARETMVAAYVVAAAAADGVEAALLARADFTGAPLALEGRRGLAALMSNAFDTATLVHGLGEEFGLENSVSAGPAAPAGGPAWAELRALVARLDRLPSIRAVVDATQAPFANENSGLS
jgi:2-methylcitrate dehydratase PrpD